MKIGGLQKLTLIDYPQKVACTLFLSGCNFRCGWCYAPELVLPKVIKEHQEIREKYFFDFLKERKGKIDGVVVCGGEPTMERKLPSLLHKIKEMNFLTKVDTNGSFPAMIKKIVDEKLVDYIAMDIKTSPKDKERYEKTTRVKVDMEKIKESIEFIMKDKVDYEFRTTLVPEIHTLQDVKEIAEEIKGAKRYYLQKFFPEKTLDSRFLEKQPFSKEELEKFKKEAEKFVNFCKIR